MGSDSCNLCGSYRLYRGVAARRVSADRGSGDARVQFGTRNPVTAYVTKFDSTGASEWIRDFTSDVPAQGGAGIAAGADSVYLAGRQVDYALSSQLHADAWVRKCNVAGVQQWTRVYDANGQVGPDRAVDVALGADTL